MKFIRLSDNSRYSWTMWARFPSAYYIIFDQFVPFIIKYFKYFLEFLYGTCNPDQNGLTGPCELFKTMFPSHIFLYSLERRVEINVCSFSALRKPQQCYWTLQAHYYIIITTNIIVYQQALFRLSHPYEKSLFKCY